MDTHNSEYNKRINISYDMKYIVCFERITFMSNYCVIMYGNLLLSGVILEHGIN